MMRSASDGVFGNSEHSDLRPLWPLGPVGLGILQGIETGLQFWATFHIFPNPLPANPLFPPDVAPLSKYCPNFDPMTSDLVVPVASARYGNTMQTTIDGFWHLEANKVPDIATRISQGLLYDAPENTFVNAFNAGFPSGQPFPLNCQ
jgi:hypothetical protein